MVDTKSDKANGSASGAANNSICGNLGNSSSSDANPSLVQNNIHKVSIRVPLFWKPDPVLWFCQLEAQFVINGIIADGTKYNTAVAHIESNILTTVGDIIRNPPNNNKYDTLKTRLIECRRLKIHFQKFFLGNRRSSELYRHMKYLAGTQLLK